MNPYQIVTDFEEAIAEYCGSKYCVGVESCTAAIFLCLVYQRQFGSYWDEKKYDEYGELNNVISLPTHTYPGVAASIIHAGFNIVFRKGPWNNWEGEYQLYPLHIWDCALRFKRGMYREKEFQCLSFHIRKLLPIGRGGAILTDNKDAYEWFRLARFDGREPVPLQEQKDFKVLGYNMYMPPADAARGLQLLQAFGDKELPDLKVEDQKYTDLSKFKIYTQDGQN